MGFFRKKITEIDMYNSTYNHILGEDFKEFHLKTNVEYDEAWVMAADRNISCLAMRAAWDGYRKKLDLIESGYLENKDIDNLDQEIISKKESILDDIRDMKSSSIKLAIGAFLIAFCLSEVGLALSRDKALPNDVEFLNKDRIAAIGNLDITNDNAVKVKKLI